MRGGAHRGVAGVMDYSEPAVSQEEEYTPQTGGPHKRQHTPEMNRWIEKESKDSHSLESPRRVRVKVQSVKILFIVCQQVKNLILAELLFVVFGIILTAYL